jgi:hypothetical protein
VKSVADSGFRAVPGAILKFSRRLKDLVDDGQQAAQYARGHIFYNNSSVWEGDPTIKGYGQAIPETGFLFSQAMEGLKNVRSELGFNYQHLWQAAQASAEELKLVADYYHATDHDIARRLDRQYGEKRTK